MAPPKSINVKGTRVTRETERAMREQAARGELGPRDVDQAWSSSQDPVLALGRHREGTNEHIDLDSACGPRPLSLLFIF